MTTYGDWDTEAPEVTYPGVTVELSETDGNVYAMISAVRRIIRKEIGTDEGADFAAKAQDKKSYDEVIQFIQETVNVI